MNTYVAFDQWNFKKSSKGKNTLSQKEETNSSIPAVDHDPNYKMRLVGIKVIRSKRNLKINFLDHIDILSHLMKDEISVPSYLVSAW